MLPFALVVSAAAGLAVGWELRRTVRALSSQPVGSRTARALAADQSRARPPVHVVADAAAALSRDDFTGFLEALEFTRAADLARLWDALNPRPESEPKRYLAAFMDRCGEIAPELGLRFLDRQVCDPEEREKSRTGYFVMWAGYHPIEAIRAAAASPQGSSRESLVQAIAGTMAKANPEIFFQERQTLRGPGTGEQVDPFSRGESSDADATVSTYDSLRAGALAELGRRDPVLATRIWAAADREEQLPAGLILARAWAETDPAAAEAWIRTWSDYDRAWGLHQIANAIAEIDPERAGALLAETYVYDNDPRKPNYGKLRAYSSYSSADLGPSAIELILHRLLHDDPAAAQDWARRYIPVQADYQVGRAVAAALPSDMDAAVERLAELDASALAEAVGSVAWNWQPRNVLERIEELAHRFPEDRREAGRALLLASAVGREPEKVIAMAADLPEGEARETVLQGAVGQWLDRSPTEATAWLGAAAAGPERDRIIFRVAAQLAEIDPPNAWAWLLTTADGSPRNEQLFEVAEEWGRRDAKAARASIEALTIDAELKADMLKSALGTDESQATETPEPSEDAFR